MHSGRREGQRGSKKRSVKKSISVSILRFTQDAVLILYTEFQGHRGFELYLQCYQLLLWKQSYWLIHSKGFPKEVEVSTLHKS